MDPPNQMFYFPPPPPMGGSLSPYQFYGTYPQPPPDDAHGGLLPPAPAPYGPPDPPPPSPPHNPHLSPSPVKTRRGRPSKATSAVASPSPSPVKRGRGRPPKNKLAAVAAAKTAKKKAVVATRAPATKTKQKALKTSTEKEKENVPIDVDDSSDSETEGTRNSNWADHEKDKVYDYLLAADDNGNRRFNQLKKNPAHVFKRCEETHFSDGSRTAKSIQSLWARSKETYGWIRAFENFTGNGGGDADSDDPTAILAHRLKGARKASLFVGSLRPETINSWEKHGWLDLFNARYGTNPKVARQVVRSSAAPISDNDDDDKVAVLGPNSDDNIDPLLLEPKTPAARKPAAVVSERKHTPASQHRLQATNSFSTINDYMKIKMVSEEKKSKAIETKVELDRMKLELEQSRVKTETDRAKVDMAREVLSAPGVSDEVKDAANGFLLNLFK